MKKIRKIRILLVAFLFTSLLLCPFAGIGYAAQEIENMTASVGVNPVFSMGVFPVSLDFSSVDPGATTAAKDLGLWCSTNNNTPWSLQISDTAELTSGSFTIPNDNFHWWGWTPGSGTWYPGTVALSTTPFTFYECGLDEYITASAVEINLTFNVEVPATQVVGTYATTLVITMTE